MVKTKLEDSIELLNTALSEAKKDPSNKVIFAGVVKCFEVTFEYVWKAFKQEANAAGYEAYNPRDSIKAAAEMGIINDFEVWKKLLNARNLTVHDYIGVSDESLPGIIKEFQKELRKIDWKKLTKE